MEKYGFFDAKLTNGVYDREYSSEDINAIFSGLLSDGVFRVYKNALKVSAGNDDLSVNVETGKAIVNEHWYINTTVTRLNINIPHATLPRYSSVVLRCDRGARSVTLAIIDGEPASTPVVPELTQNNDTYEIRLADILVGAGVTVINESDLTDARSYTSGIVDTPAVAYRRYDYTITASTQKNFDIPADYNLTLNTNLMVYADGVLIPEDNYSVQINDIEGSYMVVLLTSQEQGVLMSFVMIN